MKYKRKSIEEVNSKRADIKIQIALNKNIFFCHTDPCKLH